MNHNYYYTLLGKKAGGAGVQSGCSSTSRYLRFAQGPPSISSWQGAPGPAASAPDALAFGGVIEVWTDLQIGWPLQEGVSALYLDAARTQDLQTTGLGTWFQIEDQVFQYTASSRAIAIEATGLPARQDNISGGEPTVCANLAGPFGTPIWANSDNWQTTTKVTLDSAGAQPFPGQNLWYSIEGTTITPMGTTIQINNCGQVTGLYAC